MSPPLDASMRNVVLREGLKKQPGPGICRTGELTVPLTPGRRSKDIDQYIACKRLNSKQLAQKLGISESYMCMLRSGRRRPSPDLAQKIEAMTGIPFKRLLLRKGKSA